MTWRFGLDIEYRFEVAIISITWTALVVLGVMFAFFFRRQDPSTGPRWERKEKWRR